MAESNAERMGQQVNPTRPGARQANRGRGTISPAGTGSTGSFALRHACRPPEMTEALIPISFSSRATRALVASRSQVQ